MHVYSTVRLRARLVLQPSPPPPPVRRRGEAKEEGDGGRGGGVATVPVAPRMGGADEHKIRA